mmetsp:Transcript_27430/g.40253  ORF Transcript_27430/g.40253 Transcript_27430/m.40253 type:complete len:428 (+) Transcript_27430:2742-4025(+)
MKLSTKSAISTALLFTICTVSHALVASPIPRGGLGQQQESVPNQQVGHDVNLQTERADGRGSVKNAATTSSRKTGVSLPKAQSIAMKHSLMLTGGIMAALIGMGATGNGLDLNTLHWNGGDEFMSLFDISATSSRFAAGVVSAVPLIYLGEQIDTSDSREANQVVFGQTDSVMTLFGRRKHAEQTVGGGSHPTLAPETPMIHVLVLASLMSVGAGISNELVFRGVLPSLVDMQVHSVALAWMLQSIVYGLAQMDSKASTGENKIIVGQGMVGGAWLGLVYLLAGGDLLPSIIAHSLNNMHDDVRTWMKINSQMDYSEEAVLKRLSDDDRQELQEVSRDVALNAEALTFANRFFYAFDYDHEGALSKSNVRRAMSYAFLKDEKQPSNDRVDELFDKLVMERKTRKFPLDRIRLPEFIRMLFMLKANPV